MKKVLLLEDRLKRQETYISDANVDLQEYVDKNILDNKIGIEYTDITDSFEEFFKENVEKYNTIIVHESALKSIDKVDFLKEFCINNELSLVLFSGGVNFNSYSNEEHELVYLNSRDLYSKNFKLFLDEIENNGNFDLLLLLYGINYKKNILLSVFDNIDTFFLDENLENPFPFSDFIEEIKINEIKDSTFTLLDTDKWYELSELHKYAESLKKEIIKKVYDA